MRLSLRVPVSLAVSISVSLLLYPEAAPGEDCFLGCAAEQRSCVRSARVALQACRSACDAHTTAAERASCLSACREGWRQARQTCAAARANCGGSCLSSAVAGRTECAGSCASQLRACVATRAPRPSTCVLQCRSSQEPVRCWQDCAATLGQQTSACFAEFRACLEPCQGPPLESCPCGAECTTAAGGAGICLPPLPGGSCQCMQPACAASQCLDLRTGRCTGEPCSPSQACSQPGQVCDFFALRCPCSEAKPCAADRDCDDGRACTLDYCTPQGCQHDCVCANPFSCLPWWPVPTSPPPPARTPPPPSPEPPRDKAPCQRTGCSSQVCASKRVITTCEWRPEYGCYRFAVCEPQANGACGWTMTDAALRCFQRFGGE